uniref:Uncharacterized protein n=1 Tax=Oryctolagus cuniculus TaxID=9986 RepID=G1TH04_RABIT
FAGDEVTNHYRLSSLEHHRVITLQIWNGFSFTASRGRQGLAELPSLLGPHKGLYVETTVTYREDSVPITEKTLNYWKSWTAGHGPESWLTAKF